MQLVIFTFCYTVVMGEGDFAFIVGCCSSPEHPDVVQSLHENYAPELAGERLVWVMPIWASYLVGG